MNLMNVLPQPRLNAAVRQSHVPGTNISSAAAKADTIKDEYEDAMNKVEQVKVRVRKQLCPVYSLLYDINGNNLINYIICWW